MILDPTKYVRFTLSLLGLNSSHCSNLYLSLARSAVTVVPDLRDAVHDLPMSNLKERINDAKPLGLVRVDANELLVIYDRRYCFMTQCMRIRLTLECLSDWLLYNQTRRPKPFMWIYQMGDTRQWVCPPWQPRSTGIFAIY